MGGGGGVISEFYGILPQIDICLTARKANGRGIKTPWADACCEFPNRPEPLMNIYSSHF